MKTFDRKIIRLASAVFASLVLLLAGWIIYVYVYYLSVQRVEKLSKGV